MSRFNEKDSTSKYPLHSAKHEMFDSQMNTQPDTTYSKNTQNYEELFDSGYNSNIQSKTFLDLDNELESVQSKHEQNEKETSIKSPSVQQWTDSGVCITDSGLSINEDFNNEVQVSINNSSIRDIEAHRNKLNDESKDFLKIWLKQNSEGDTLLHLAIIEGLEDIACSIIKNLSSSSEMLNSYNYLYQTPLHLAVLKKQMNTIQMLIARGVSITFQDNLGNTPLHIACKYSLIDVVKIFFSASPKMSTFSNWFEIRNYDGDTCVHLAAYNNDYKLLEFLIGAGADINIQEGKSGKTVLHYAVENLNIPFIYFLLKKCNANVQSITFAGKTPIHLAYKMHVSAKNEQISNTIKLKTHKILKMFIEYSVDAKTTLEAINDGSDSDVSSDSEE